MAPRLLSTMLPCCHLFALLLLLVSLHAPTAASLSFQFDFSTSDYASDLKYSNDSYWEKPVVELTKGHRGDSISDSVGRVWYALPVPLWDRATGELASFDTAFSFSFSAPSSRRSCSATRSSSSSPSPAPCPAARQRPIQRQTSARSGGGGLDLPSCTGFSLPSSCGAPVLLCCCYVLLQILALRLAATLNAALLLLQILLLQVQR